MRSLAPESCSWNCSSGAASRVFSGTKIAPSSPQAKKVSTKEGWFSPR
jgi:hypothetical protein